jgi:hypothetical protein
MKKLLIVLSLIFLFALCGISQNLTESRKIDEFGDLNAESLTVAIDTFSIELANNPTAKGYVIIYRDEKMPYGQPIRSGTKIKKYLTLHRGVSSERFEVINAGLLGERKTEIWIVPGGKLPRFDSVDKELNTEKSVLFDSLPYPSDYDGAGCCAITGYTEEAKKNSIAEFIRQLKKRPNAEAYIILYGQFCNDCSSSAVWSKTGDYLGLKPDIYFDSIPTIQKVLSKEKSALAKLSNLSPSKIKIINGGYRKWREMELWIVPPNDGIPTPQPETFPARKTYRNTRKIY